MPTATATWSAPAWRPGSKAMFAEDYPFESTQATGQFLDEVPPGLCARVSRSKTASRLGLVARPDQRLHPVARGSLELPGAMNVPAKGRSLANGRCGCCVERAAFLRGRFRAIEQ